MTENRPLSARRGTIVPRVSFREARKKWNLFGGGGALKGLAVVPGHPVGGGWLAEQIEQKKVEPNSGLGEAIGYMLRHWEAKK